MGCYTELSVDGYHLFSEKNIVDPVVMTLFTEENKLIEGTQNDLEIKYSASGLILRDRLDAMGFTLKVAREAFEAGIKMELEEAEDSLNRKNPLEIEHVYEEHVRILRTLTFDKWIDTFLSLKRKKVSSYSRVLNDDDPESKTLEPLEQFILGKEFYPFYFLNDDPRYLLRVIIEVSGDGCVIDFDVSDVVLNTGNYVISDDLTRLTRAQLVADYPINAKVIMLTEGVTDGRLLEAAMQLLYPHLSDYYSFMDFDGVNAAGGASQLVHTIKAFTGAGIANRVIALFDNDTAARSAMRGLSGITLPTSMKVLQYPPILIAKSYPTEGPSGLALMDVNGLAGAIEMYFGRDVLQRPDGTLTPVHWNGYDSALRAYQGELEGKAQLQKAFEEKITNAKHAPSLVNTMDWGGMRVILDMIRHTFENTSPQVWRP